MSIPEKIKEIAEFSDDKLQTHLNTAPLKELHSLKLYADDIYYNTPDSSGFSDWQYDILKDILERRDPDYVVPIGARIRAGANRVRLPYWLGSMDKIKMEPEFQNLTLPKLKSILVEELKKKRKIEHSDSPKELRKIKSRISDVEQQIAQLRFLKKWIRKNKGPYVIEDKLDGVSCLVTNKNGKIRLYTRGDGMVGANISYLAQYFDTIPSNLKDDIAVRGELIMPNAVFEEKYAKDYANPRNLVAGRTGAKTIKKGIRDIRFIAYEIVSNGIMPKPSDQFKHLKKLGFTVVNHNTIRKVTATYLAKIIVEWKVKSPYEIDGLIIQTDKPYERNIKGNPSYAFAFKMRMGDNIVDVTVTGVEWNLSKWGKIKPTVLYEPRRLKGSTVSRATGVHARFIWDNRIGPGARVRITKKGDIIPNILAVLESASSAQMPAPPCEWKWNKTKIDILATNDDCGQICIKIMHSFLKENGFKQLGPRAVETMYEAGIDSILRILLVNKQQLLDAGFGEGQAIVITSSISKTLKNGMNLAKMLGTSGVLGHGIGRTKAALLLQKYPNILQEQGTMLHVELIRQIMSIDGFAVLSAEITAKNLPWAAKFSQAMSMLTTFNSSPSSGGLLRGYTVVISGTLPGYSREQVKITVEKAGGRNAGSVKKPKSGLKQIVVIVGSLTTKKAKDAKKYRIKTYSVEEFFKILEEGPPKE
jgi:NAD-dependent DNA ligase